MPPRVESPRIIDRTLPGARSRASLTLETGHNRFRKGRSGSGDKESLQGKQDSFLYRDIFEEVDQRNVGIFKYAYLCLYEILGPPLRVLNSLIVRSNIKVYKI